MFGGGKTKLRFDVGTEVLCQTGPDEWSAGRVVMHNYREPDWPRGRTVPYQVQLEDGGLIFVPQDVEQLCRKLELPWWGELLKGKQPPSMKQLRKACDGKDVNEQDHTGNTALLAAVRRSWQPAVVDLIGMSADVNICSQSKQSPLHLAVFLGPSMSQTLLQAKANPNIQDTDPDFDPEFTSTTFGNRLEHRTPLHYCCGAMGNAALATMLIEAGAELDIQDAQYKTPLHLAIEEKREQVIDVLLQKRADVNLGNMESGMKNTPLMDAAHKGKCELAQKLIASKADVNAQGKSDMSALHLAARRGDINLVQVLVAAGADVAQKSQCGTAADLAKKKPGGAALLEALGVKADEPKSGKAPTSVATMDAAQRAALFLE